MLAHYYAATLAAILGSAAAEALDAKDRTFRRAPAMVPASGAPRRIPAPLRILRVNAGVLRDLLRRCR